MNEGQFWRFIGKLSLSWGPSTKNANIKLSHGSQNVAMIGRQAGRQADRQTAGGRAGRQEGR